MTIKACVVCGAIDGTPHDIGCTRNLCGFCGDTSSGGHFGGCPEGRPPRPITRADTDFDHGLIDELVAARDAMGWHPACERNLPTRLLCVVAELEEVASAPPASFAEEVADVAMYLLCIRYDWRERGRQHPPRAYATRSTGRYSISGGLAGRLASVRVYLVRAFEAWRRLNDPHRTADIASSIDLALLEVVRLAEYTQVDIDAAIRAKIEVLRTREACNGGKHPDS